VAQLAGSMAPTSEPTKAVCIATWEVADTKDLSDADLRWDVAHPGQNTWTPVEQRDPGGTAVATLLKMNANAHCA